MAGGPVFCPLFRCWCPCRRLFRCMRIFRLSPVSPLPVGRERPVFFVDCPAQRPEKETSHKCRCSRALFPGFSSRSGFQDFGAKNGISFGSLFHRIPAGRPLTAEIRRCSEPAKLPVPAALSLGRLIMRTRSACRCLLCELESHLKQELRAAAREDEYARLAASGPLLSGFPSAPVLSAHLRACRSNGNGIHPADVILTEMLHLRRQSGRDTLLRDILLLAFIPMLHSTSRQLARRYPFLAPDDTAQHLVVSAPRNARFSGNSRP